MSIKQAHNKPQSLDVLANHGFLKNRMIALNRDTYIKRNPNHKAIFNANIATLEGKIWWGDLDLNIDSKALQQVANELNTTLYILRSSAYRFIKKQGADYDVEKFAVKKFFPKSNQTKKNIIKCLQSLVSKVIQFFSVTRKQ